MKKFRRFLIIILLLATVTSMLWLDSNYRVVTEEYTVTSERLPESADGLRIVHLTDLHGEWSESLYRRIAEAKPDIICITGDIVDGITENFEAERDYILRAVSEMLSIAPVYYVPGNHEWASRRAKELIGSVSIAGGTVLRNDYEIFRGIIIAGCDDPNGPYDQPKPEDTVAKIREDAGGGFMLMLYHRHDRIDVWAPLGVDCVLCGHAHGGMMRLPFTDGVYAPGHHFFPKYTSGIYYKGKTAEVVSRGIGGPKYRLFNNPEILVLNLKKG